MGMEGSRGGDCLCVCAVRSLRSVEASRTASLHRVKTKHGPEGSCEAHERELPISRILSTGFPAPLWTSWYSEEKTNDDTHSLGMRIPLVAVTPGKMRNSVQQLFEQSKGESENETHGVP